MTNTKWNLTQTTLKIGALPDIINYIAHKQDIPQAWEFAKIDIFKSNKRFN